jgi:hypothetical protein
LIGDSGLILRVSTTSTSPSQRPTDVPIQFLTPEPTCLRPSVGMTRVSWIISFWKASQPGPCTMRLPEL